MPHYSGGTYEEPEECDGSDLGGQTCAGLGFDGGTLACTGGCSFDSSECYVCGNNVIEGPEVCDGTDLAGQSCQSLGFDDGILACLSGCAGFDVSGCFNDPSSEPRFTGKELESGLDLYYFGARYLDSRVGRFATPDPAEPDLSNPQSLNRYAYGLNSPYRFVDPDGGTVVGYTGFLNLPGGITKAIDVLQGFPDVVGAARVFRYQDDFLGSAFLLNEFESGRSNLNALVGHSFGAFAALNTAHRLNKIGNGVPVDLLLTVDAALNFGTQTVPSNVRVAINFRRDALFYGGTELVAADPTRTEVLNIDLGDISHTQIDDFLAISIAGEVLKVASGSAFSVGELLTEQE